MASLLIENVLPHPANLRLADRNSEVLLLPQESDGEQCVIIDPVGRLSLDQLHHSGNRLVGTKHHQEVQVVLDAVDTIDDDVLELRVRDDMFDYE